MPPVCSQSPAPNPPHNHQPARPLPPPAQPPTRGNSLQTLWMPSGAAMSVRKRILDSSTPRPSSTCTQEKQGGVCASGAAGSHSSSQAATWWGAAEAAARRAGELLRKACPGSNPSHPWASSRQPVCHLLAGSASLRLARMPFTPRPQIGAGHAPAASTLGEGNGNANTLGDGNSGDSNSATPQANANPPAGPRRAPAPLSPAPPSCRCPGWGP